MKIIRLRKRRNTSPLDRSRSYRLESGRISGLPFLKNILQFTELHFNAYVNYIFYLLYLNGYYHQFPLSFSEESMAHYCNVTCAPWRLKTRGTRMFIQQLYGTNDKKQNIKASQTTRDVNYFHWFSGTSIPHRSVGFSLLHVFIMRVKKDWCTYAECDECTDMNLSDCY